MNYQAAVLAHRFNCDRLRAVCIDHVIEARGRNNFVEIRVFRKRADIRRKPVSQQTADGRSEQFFGSGQLRGSRSRYIRNFANEKTERNCVRLHVPTR